MMNLVKDGVVDHLRWHGSSLRFLDQTLLPHEQIFVEASDYREICDAIRRLAIRGAPAIGIAAGYAFALGAQQIRTDNMDRFRKEAAVIRGEIACTRPTAVNLCWALDRLMSAMEQVHAVSGAKDRIVSEAERIHGEDIDTCRRLSNLGKALMPESGSVMTYCNAGGLATGGYGTALGVIYAAHQDGKDFHVIVNETRPLFQGTRLTAWELKEAGIPFVLATDNMAAQTFGKGVVRCVVVGADRIALNGDTANKIGTYNLAILADYHHVPFYVAAPTSTIDTQMQSGMEIPIEQRDESEVTRLFGKPVAPQGTAAMNPAFDVTPSHLISAIITEKAICRAPYNTSFEQIL